MLSATSSPWQLARLAADSADELEQATQQLHELMRRRADDDPAGLVGTEHGLSHHGRYRRIILYQGFDDGVRALETRHPRVVRHAEVNGGQPPPVAFMFPGGGAQYAGMAADVYATEDEFRCGIDECATLFRVELGIDVRDALLPQEGLPADAVERPPLGLASLFAVEYALARLWRCRGVTPAMLIGHSLGEYVAATVAGVLSLVDAIRLVALRARLMDDLSPGAMLIVQAREGDLMAQLESDVSLAAINSPAQCVVSGPIDSINALEKRLVATEVKVRRLRIGVAGHSALIDGVLDEFGRLARSIQSRGPSIPMVSNLTGTWLTESDATDPEYWVRHLRSPVRFAQGIKALLTEAPVVLLEVGPGTTLTTLGRQNGAIPSPISSLRHPLDPRPDAAVLAMAGGELWLAGVAID